jgi:hypothetical protein
MAGERTARRHARRVPPTAASLLLASVLGLVLGGCWTIGGGGGGGVPPADLCAVDAPAVIGTVASTELDEVSGLASSKTQADVLWAHNDSGDAARLFAMDESGASLGTYPLSGVTALDWEDLAQAPGPQTGTNYLYVGDIGDNNGTRGQIQVYRVPEPTASPSGATLSGVTTLRYVYPSGAHLDAEALMVDPVRGDLYVITKSASGAARVYRAAAPLAAGPTTLTRVATLSLPAGTMVTAADVSTDGRQVALRTYGEVLVYKRDITKALHTAFATASCTPPAPVEGQGEAITIAPGGREYVTIGEGAHRPINRARQP